MGFIETRPPVTQTEIEDLIAGLESAKSKNFDGFILSNLVRTCHECALKKAELIKLSIMDVASGGKIRDFMEVGDSVIKLSGQAKKFLQAHIDYLKIKEYKVNPKSPFFPIIKDRRYTAKTLDNHLKEAQNAESKPDGPSTKASDTEKTDITLEQIRQAGICSHYENLKSQGLPRRDCLKETVEFARVSYRQIKGVLSGNIQSTGKKENSVSEYLKEIEDVKWELARTGSVTKGRPYPEIQRAIERDTKLNDEEKKALKSDIDRSIKEVDELSRKINAPDPKPRYNSIADAVKNFDIK